MKLACFSHKNNPQLGIAVGKDHCLSLDTLFPTGDMAELINSGKAGWHSVKEYYEKQAANQELLIPVAEISWLPPVTKPGKICGVAMNNSASNARKISAPDHPAFFLKPTSCLVGHLNPIVVRSYYGSVHPEPELAVVIGKTGRDIEPEAALDHVFGYTIFDDITGNGMRAEDLFRYYALYPKKDNPEEVEKVEQHLSYAARYKGTDTFGCMGPWLVTADEIQDPDNLDVLCRAGGELIAEDSTRYYNYKVAEVISFISRFHTLDAGDVISMGTAFKPSATRKSIHHANLQVVPGPVEVEIEGLGKLINPVIVEKGELGRWQLNPKD
jgi:2,4-didehydro-3-deoxy-L-rhamnonate hydrolase